MSYEATETIVKKIVDEVVHSGLPKVISESVNHVLKKLTLGGTGIVETSVN